MTIELRLSPRCRGPRPLPRCRRQPSGTAVVASGGLYGALMDGLQAGAARGFRGGGQWPAAHASPCVRRALRPLGWAELSRAWRTYWARLTKTTSGGTWRHSSGATPTSGPFPTRF